VFQQVLPLAASKGFRMVCLNRRDYPGSTAYTDAELKALSEGDADVLESRGVELAYVLVDLVDALSLPMPTVDGNEGGLGLMGWSMGNLFTLGAIASVSALQPRVQLELQSYLRKLIVFGEIAGGTYVWVFSQIAY
jgi:pimeloyl-ACP methyl ester carboxylesterase